MTTPTTPHAPTAPPQVKVPQEKVAQRAYEKWVKRGMKHGSDVQDWLEAEAEVRSEMGRAGGTNTRK
jgi:hypothetical protein